MLRPVSAFFAPRLHVIDKFLLEHSNGKISLAAILGWDILELTTLGAKTGQPRKMPLVTIVAGEKFIVIASSFGRLHNPGWYYNLKARPECEVLFNGRTGKYIARETEGAEYQQYLEMFVSVYAGYEKYRERAAHRHLPILVLEPKDSFTSNPA
jgi:deazaflavin-dependent oxidoreductase (nitroreductase family)